MGCDVADDTGGATAPCGVADGTALVAREAGSPPGQRDEPESPEMVMPCMTASQASSSKAPFWHTSVTDRTME
ncbi:hypothetical protein [Actinomyces israelii]|uniref:hypothetical protein n=1 Tax=Actinomyces israelii TaxID=1659 RepID=UPI00235462AF|nr:hypothetical protein [Actinomyces israelii]